MPPEEWLVSRVCEEFGCLPSAAVAELEQDGPGLVLTILSLRALARAKEAYEQAQDADRMASRGADGPRISAVDRLGQGELVTMVKRMDFGRPGWRLEDVEP